MTATTYTLDDLLAIMARLRTPQTGCEWDLQQDFASIIPHTISEVYELVEAIESGDDDAICDELGDVLFQLIFYTRMGSEQGRFDFPRVIHGLCQKLIRRHPHVFGTEVRKLSPEQVSRQWQEIKDEERGSADDGRSMARVHSGQPPLTRALKMQELAAAEGMDWPDVQGAIARLEEETGELRSALTLEEPERRTALSAELGDLLFCCVNIARHLDLDAEHSLRQANRRFEARFEEVAHLAAERGQNLRELSAGQIDMLWETAKSTVENRNSE